LAAVREDPAMHVVAVLLLDEVMPFELGIPHRIFGSVVDADGRSPYRVVTCSLDGRPVRTSADFAIEVEQGPEVVAAADTVVIPPFGSPDRPLADAERERVRVALEGLRPGSRLVSLCGAAFLLAETGHLDGRPATTHWVLTEQFRTAFPTVDLDPGVLFVDDGDVLTAAGAAAGIDLCLHIVRRDHGAEAANRVARHCVVPPHRDGGQQQFIEHVVPAVAAVSTEPARTWAVQHLSERVSLADLARRSHMSVRTFTRRFRHETGVSPQQWLLTQRVELARRLLESTDLPVERVASEAGLGTAAGMRAHFQRSVGVSPSAYRRTFRADASRSEVDRRSEDRSAAPHP
jgi:transcriptional regulator GlxA family with amidase domain